jgi:protease-4
MWKRRLTIVLAVVAVGAILLTLLQQSGPRVQDGSVLVLELAGEIPEAPPSGALAQLSSAPPALVTLLLQLDKVRADPRIEGVLLHLRDVTAGFARLEELRDSVVRTRSAGKKIVALLDFAALGATAELFIASAADEVYVVPGFLGPVTGISGEFMYLGDALEQLGVAVEYERIGAYKSAPEMYAGSAMSEPAREMYDALLDDIYGQLIGGIAEGRKLEPEKLRALVDTAPGTPSEWVEAGLADGIRGREDVLLAAGFAKDVPEVTLATYLRVDPADLGLRGGPRIAIVFGEGTIVPAGGGASSFGADRVTQSLRDAGDDDSVRAIVLRINSGGGSALASEQVWRAVFDVRKKKPVIASMSDAAASGGYYIASAATKIVAEPTTQTGSIGVFFLRVSAADLLAKVGVKTALLERGKLAGLGALSRSLGEAEQARLRDMVSDAYATFLARVAEGREMTPEAVDAVGQGRVWTGLRALEHGLIDALGGLDVAVALAKEAAAIPDDVDPERTVLTRQVGLLQELQELLLGQVDTGLALDPDLLLRVPAAWRGLARASAGLTQLAPCCLRID